MKHRYMRSKYAHSSRHNHTNIYYELYAYHAFLQKLCKKVPVLEVLYCTAVGKQVLFVCSSILVTSLFTDGGAVSIEVLVDPKTCRHVKCCKLFSCIEYVA